MRKRATATVIADGLEIRRLRIDRGLSRAEFVEAAKPYGPVSVRLLGKVEKGQARCRLEKLKIIASTLECTVKEITIGRTKVPRAMSDEVVAAAEAGMGKEGSGALARLFDALDRAVDRERAEWEVLLGLAIRRDVMGDALGALRLGCLVINELPSPTSDLAVRARVRVAAFEDHAGRPRAGLDKLEFVRQRAASKTSLSDEEWWAMYQFAVLLAHDGRIREAKNALAKVRNGAPRTEHRIAALHQQGVLAMRAQQLDDAETIFLTCLKERAETGMDDFRIVYDYRRLYQVAKQRGRPDEAKAYKRKTQQVLRRWAFERFTVG